MKAYDDTKAKPTKGQGPYAVQDGTNELVPDITSSPGRV